MTMVNPKVDRQVIGQENGPLPGARNNNGQNCRG